MSNLFEDDEEKELMAEDDFVEAEETIQNHSQRPNLDARRRLESLLEERRLRDELEDFLDY